MEQPGAVPALRCPGGVSGGSGILCRQRGLTRLDCYRAEWYEELTNYPFAGGSFPGPKDYDAVLTSQFGDYMTLPPEEERENRHQIIRVDFGHRNITEETR